MIARTSACSHPHAHGNGCRTAKPPGECHPFVANDPPASGAAVQPDPPRHWWQQIIAYLRRWSGDDAYERYLADHQSHGHELLSRREFYKRYLDHRAGGSRCC